MPQEPTDLERFDPCDTYDVAALDYVRAAERFWDFLSHRALAGLPLGPGARVLDVPSGPGTATVAAAQRVGEDGRVVAMDSSPRMLDLARERAVALNLQNVEFELGDMTALPYPEASFDAVLSVLGIFFVTDMTGLLRSLWGLVKPGGALVVSTLGPRAFDPAFTIWKRAVLTERPEALTAFPWERTDDPEGVAQLLEDAGIRADVRLELAEVEIPTASDWWLAVMGSGMRRTIQDLDDGEIRRVRERCAREFAEREVRAMGVPGIHAWATKA